MKEVYIALSIFLGITILIGFISGRKVRSFEDYAFGSSKLHVGVLGMSFLATFVCAGNLQIANEYAADGIIQYSQEIFILSSFLLFAWFFAGRLEKFSACKTLGGVVDRGYGKPLRLFSAILGIVACLMIAGAQLVYLKSITTHVLGISSHRFIIATGLLLTLYMVSGGFRSVALTDVLQLGAVIIGVVFFAEEAIVKLGENGEEKGLGALYSKLKGNEEHAERLLFWKNPELLSWLSDGFFWSFFPSLLISPPILQRMLMTNKSDTRKVLVSSGVFNLVFGFFLAVIGLSALFLIPSALPAEGEAVDSQWVFAGMLDYLFANRPWLMAIVIVGMFSIMLSTIDSFIHAAVVLGVYDIIRPMRSDSDAKAPSTKKDLKLARIITVLFISFLLSIIFIDDTGEERVLPILSYAYALLSLLVIPLLSAIVRGKRGSDRAFWASVGVGILALGITRPLLPHFFPALQSDDVDEEFMLTYAWFVAIVLHMLTFFLVQVMDSKRIKMLEREESQRNNSGERLVVRERSVVSKVKHWFAKLENPAAEARKRSESYGGSAFSFTWFTFILFMVPTWHPDHLFIAAVRFVGFLLCAGLLARSVWPQKLRPYFALYYFVTIAYCIPFASTLLFLTQADSSMVHTILLLSLLLLITLVDWKSFFLLSILGGFAAILAYRLRTGVAYYPELPWGTWWDISVKLFFTTFIGLIFMRKKEQHSSEKKRRLLGKIQEQDARIELAVDTQAQLSSTLHPASSALSEIATRIIALESEGANKAHIISIKRALEHLKETKAQSESYLPMAPEQEQLREILNQVAEKLVKIDCEIIPTVYQHYRHDSIVCDVDHVVKLIVNSMQHIVLYHPDKDIFFYLDDATLDCGSVEGAKQVVSCCRFTISTRRQYQLEDKVSYTLKGLALLFEKDRHYLLENKRITEAHYGVMTFDETEDVCTQCYVLPYDLSIVRPKISRFSDENVAEVTRLDAPEDIAFLNVVEEKKLNIELIKKALLDCKHYHRQQVRKSGDPYYLHPVRVATELIHHTRDIDLVVAGLLHDTVEDTPYTLNQIAMRYGERVQTIVAEVTNLYNRESRKIKLKKQEKFANMLKKSNRDSMTVKLFDRLDNMRTIQGLPKAKRAIIAQETMDFFVPMAKALGYKEVEEELIACGKPYLTA